MDHNSQDETQARALRAALGRFPTGVAVVTALTDNLLPVGMTISSFNSVSLSPALISWCIDRDAASYATFSRVRAFSVSVLSQNQAELAMRFATRGANKFHDIPLTHEREPLIPDACAWFRCEAFHRVILGDHAMLIGSVVDFSASGGRPLVFAGGRFQELATEVESLTWAA
jgi:flavin reductase (DIM6/NTAB) family NADH-FMN oxidoreductase RutF